MYEIVFWHRLLANGAFLFLFALEANAQESATTAAAARYKAVMLKAQVGDPEAQNLLGVLYQIGSGTIRNEAEAERWYKMATDQDHAAAQVNLGTLYYEGKDISHDVAKSFRLFEQSAQQGLPLGIAKLGYAYHAGFNGQADYDKGMELLQKASEMGDGYAAYQIGVIHEYGHGGRPVDKMEALRWFKLSAERGYAAGQFAYGTYFGQGAAGIKRDWDEAMRWYRRAAEGGNTYAQFVVGQQYEIVRDIAQAEQWYRRAAEGGDGVSEQALFRLGFPGVGGRMPIVPDLSALTASKPRKVTGDEFATGVFAAGLGIAIMSMGVEPGEDLELEYEPIEPKSWCDVNGALDPNC